MDMLQAAKLSAHATIPTRGSYSNSGYDLYSAVYVCQKEKFDRWNFNIQWNIMMPHIFVVSY